MSQAIRKIQSPITGEIVFTVVTEDQNEWEVVKQASTVELTSKEKLIAAAKNFDLKKFLLVKQLLMDGLSHSNIKDKTGISKNTISKYRKFYCKKTIDLIK